MAKLSVVYGGQWGSEGKGQVVRWLSRTTPYRITAVRVGGPNAGHTIYPDGPGGEAYKLQQIPCPAFVSREAVIVLGASSVILPEVLTRELLQLEERWGVGKTPPIFIDEKATMITPDHMQQEAADIVGRISSTGEGVGAATADKVMRRATTFDEWLVTGCSPGEREILGRTITGVIDTVRLLNLHTQSRNRHIIVEGTQGYLLSLNTSGYYPFTTSRDCGPEALMGQVGLSFRAFAPEDIRVLAVFRTFPIRVGGPSGPLPGETTWEILKERTGGYVSEPEITTVTKKVRRIADWNRELARKTVIETIPTEIALTFLDYVCPPAHTSVCYVDLPEDARLFVERVQQDLGVPVAMVSVGPGMTFSTGQEDRLW